MIIDKYGLPRDNNATDAADSARLAGIMALIGHPLAPSLGDYFVFYQGKIAPVRHPIENKFPENDPRTMSRDQLVCLAAGLWAQKKHNLADEIRKSCRFFAPNTLNEETKTWKIPDPIGFAVRAHFKMCADPNYQLSRFEKNMLRLEITGSVFEPWSEQNQIMCMCIVAGHEFVWYYKQANPFWAESIRHYWIRSHRADPDLATLFIEVFGRL